MRKRTKKNRGKELDKFRNQYKEIKERILKIGFICKGSICKRCIPCGNPNCVCHKDPKKRHGPYYQLTWKEKGKTLSHYLSADDVELYREWIQNRHILMELVDELEVVSRKAGAYIRSVDNERNRAKKSNRKRKKQTKKRP
jgi:hypothetical protein